MYETGPFKLTTIYNRLQKEGRLKGFNDIFLNHLITGLGMGVNDEGRGEQAWLDTYRRVYFNSKEPSYLTLKMAHIAKGEWHKIDQEIKLLFEAPEA